jgi:cytochrome P450 / NADPH-cytochrome P450 reductase
LDILDRYPSISITFDQFLALVPPLKIRQYSISSSPLKDPGSLTLTYSVIDAPAFSGSGQYYGVTSTYLRSLKAGDQLLVSVKSTNKFFRPPTDPESTPIIMFCAGSGIAPFRGFVEERALFIKNGQRKLAKAILFVGCQSPNWDCLYTDEFEEWQKLGAVDVRYAFSRDSDSSFGCKYVQDRVIRDKTEIYKLWASGAKIYVCGSNTVAKEVGQAARQLVKESASKHGKEMSDKDLDHWLKERRNERILADVFQ